LARDGFLDKAKFWVSRGDQHAWPSWRTA